uniref:DUF4939 domain-containing protein n=1 Tax=Nothobranchius kuhntae TaxID=321403 RepID=A0A1A8JQK8_NOTKU
MDRPTQDPAGSPGTQEMYFYDGDPELCVEFIRTCVRCLDLKSSEFNKVSFMVLWMRGKAMQWVAEMFEVEDLKAVSFWDLAKKVLQAFGCDPPSPVAPATFSSTSPPSASRLQSLPTPVHTIRTGFISLSPEPVGAFSAPPLDQTTTLLPDPDNAASSPRVGCHSSSFSVSTTCTPSFGPDSAAASSPGGCHSSSVPASVFSMPLSQKTPRRCRRNHPASAVVLVDASPPPPAVVPVDASLPVQPFQEALIQPFQETPSSPALPGLKSTPPVPVSSLHVPASGLHVPRLRSPRPHSRKPSHKPSSSHKRSHKCSHMSFHKCSSSLKCSSPRIKSSSRRP